MPDLNPTASSTMAPCVLLGIAGVGALRITPLSRPLLTIG
jgi:hypothetical protein